MRKIACIFPGQGAQSVGMGKELYHEYDEVREVFDQADHILGFSISQLCFEGLQEELNLTRNSQVALFTFSVACDRLLKSYISDFKPDAVAGLSLGEFTALCSAGAFDFETGLRIVKVRSEYMDKACRENPGTMASIIGLDLESVKGLCIDVKDALVQVANVNYAKQIVVSGSEAGVAEAMKLAKARGARKVVPLKVQGAFHSPLMQSAREGLASYIKNIPIQSPQSHFFANVTGHELTDPEEIRNALIQQVTDSVLWLQNVEGFSQLGINTTLELGSGKILSSFQRKIKSNTEILNVEDRKTFEYTISQLMSS